MPGPRHAARLRHEGANGFSSIVSAVFQTPTSLADGQSWRGASAEWREESAIHPIRWPVVVCRSDHQQSCAIPTRPLALYSLQTPMAVVPGVRLGPYEESAPSLARAAWERYTEATDTRLRRTVAIKVLRLNRSTIPSASGGFCRRPEQPRPSIIPTSSRSTTIGEHAGVEFIVMEHLPGKTLEDHIARGPVAPAKVLGYAIQIASALSAAHRAGIVHRDLKPANVIVTEQGSVKVLDFGLAKMRAVAGDATTDALTQEGMILGTLQYMAPEQLEGKEADARTDIFAFGALVYEMATGRKAFEGKSQASVIAAILEGEPAPISTLQPLVPAELDRLVATCLAKDPNERWQNTTDLARELKSIAGRGSISGTSAPSAKAIRFSERLGWIAAVLAVAVMAGWVGFRIAGAKRVAAQTQRLTMPLTVGQFLGSPFMVLSRDGTRVSIQAFRPAPIRACICAGLIDSKPPRSQARRALSCHSCHPTNSG